MTSGAIVPDHRKGHCLYDPTWTGKQLCGEPAPWHVLLPEQEGGTYACAEHLQECLRLTDAEDYHPIDHRCTETHPKMLWRYTTPARFGWCYIEGDEDTALAAELAELVSTAGSPTERQEHAR